MGRPWWYDSYWEKKNKGLKRRRFMPTGPLLSWIIFLAIVFFLALWRSIK